MGFYKKSNKIENLSHYMHQTCSALMFVCRMMMLSLLQSLFGFHQFSVLPFKVLHVKRLQMASHDLRSKDLD
jgi:hypothetical protein